jgi:hypothetical protein
MGNGQKKFEAQIMACALLDASFYAALKNVVCTETQPGFMELDFKTTGMNKLWKLVGEYYDLFGEFDARPPIDSAIELLIKDKVASNEYSDVDARTVATAFNTAEEESLDKSLSMWVGIYQSAAPAWVAAARAEKAVALRHAGLITTKDLTDRLETSQRVGTTAASLLETFGSKNNEPPYGMPTPWSALTASTHGIVKGTSTLFVAERGAGKTVIATQLASFFVDIGFKGLYIYTEQTRRDLEARMMCQMFNLPISLFAVKGIQWDKDPKPPDIMFEALHKFGDSLLLDGYKRTTGRSILKSYEASVNACADRLGAMPDFVVVDWPGNALQAQEGTPEYRGEYGASVQRISQSALRNNYAAIVFAQASAVKARNKKAVDGYCVAENTALDASIAAGVGLSKLTWGEESRSGAPLIRINQYLSVFKSRLGTSKLIPVHRNYACQKLGEGHIPNEYNPLISGRQQTVPLKTHPDLVEWCAELQKIQTT